MFNRDNGREAAPYTEHRHSRSLSCEVRKSGWHLYHGVLAHKLYDALIDGRLQGNDLRVGYARTWSNLSLVAA